MGDIVEFVEFLSQEKVMNIKIYNKFDWFHAIFGTATSARHIRALVKMIKSKKIINGNDVFSDIGNEWVICSFYTFDLHLFTQSKREYYDLDSLWGENYAK